MLHFSHPVAGEPCDIYVPQHPEDLTGFDTFLARGDRILGFDTEGTGKDIFIPEHRLRAVQFGNSTEAWVLNADQFPGEIVRALRQPRQFVAHNAPFDALSVDRHLGVRIEELMPRLIDTHILAHLLDPRGAKEGGLGFRLKPLCSFHVDAHAPDTADGLTAVFRSLGLNKTNGWARIPFEDPTYLTYAGLDAILVARLFDRLAPRVRWRAMTELCHFEHHVQAILAGVQRRGVRLDVSYVEGLREQLKAEAAHFADVATGFGIGNVNSNAQIIAALQSMGERLYDTTPTGAPKVDRAVLAPLADLDNDWERVGLREPNWAADAVMRSKRASKWGVTYAQAFLALRDAQDRLHPQIEALAARTARMGVSRPPLQQLPTSDWRIRRAFIPDDGMAMIAVDYQAVEMRVLAALADVPRMKAAIAAGEDLHDFTARLIEGEHFTPKHRKLFKNVGFGKVFGGGPYTIARLTGFPFPAVARAINAYDSMYPQIEVFSRQLIRNARQGIPEVVTPRGRHLPLDAHRLYSATNYLVQSTSRDLLAQAIVDVHHAGLGEHLLLPVHDELLAQAPERDAADVVQQLAKVMSTRIFGVPIDADTEIYGPSWGHGYGAPELQAAGV